MKALAELGEYLNRLRPGGVSEPSKVIALLARCWDDLSGSGTTNMSSDKIGRIEAIEWHPPRLTFVIERHGGTVMGSTRAALYRWTIDIDQGHAECDSSNSYRQLCDRDQPLTVDPLITDTVALVTSGSNDTRLKWFPDRDSVRVLVGDFITGKYAQTRAGRRRRFRTVLERRLEAVGWVRVPGKLDLYHRSVRSLSASHTCMDGHLTEP